MLFRRQSLLPSLAILVIVATIPFAIVETFQLGRVYLFSREFFAELPQRFSGPGRFRFVMQPLIAIVLGLRGGLVDAKAGKPPYLFGLAFAPDHRRELLRSGLAALRNLLAVGIVLDVVFQVILYQSVHPGAALVVGPIFICVPYVIARAFTTRLARQPDSEKDQE